MNTPSIAMPKITAGGDLAKSITIAVPALSILISIGIGFFIVWPKFNEVMALRNANKEMVARAETLEGKADALQGLDKNLLTRQLELSEQLLPSEKNVFTFLATLENAALTSGVLVNKMDVVSDSLNESTTAQAASQATTAGSKKTITAPNIEVKLSFSSSYQSLLQFMNTLLSTSRIVEMDDLSVSAARSEGSALTTAFTLKAYWSPLPSDLGAIENKLEKLTTGEAQLLDKVKIDVESTPQVILTVPSLGRSDLFAPF